MNTSKETEMTEFCVVKEYKGICFLDIKYGGTITIKEDGIIEGAKNVIQSGPTLVIYGSTENEAYYSKDGLHLNPKDGITIECKSGMIIDSIQGCHRILINEKINTQDITGKFYFSKCLDGVEKNKPNIIYKLNSNCQISYISIHNNAILNPLPLKFINRTFNIDVRDGRVQLPKAKFRNININVSGIGDVIGYETISNTANIKLSNSGDVRELHILNSCTISIKRSREVIIDSRHNIKKTDLPRYI